MKYRVLRKLVRLADALDNRGLKKEADTVDSIICAAVSRSGKDTWKYTSKSHSGEFSRDSAAIWSANTPEFALKHTSEISRLKDGESIELVLTEPLTGTVKVKVTRTSTVKIEGAETPAPPDRNKLIEELEDQRKSIGGKREFISRMMKEPPTESSEKLWPYLDKGRHHEEWRLEFSDEPDDDPLVSKIPLTEKTTDAEISAIADQLLAAVQKLRAVN